MIEELEIVKYKGFKNLKLNNLSQINIISGENNIGKTALLEVISIVENCENLENFRNNLALIFRRRDLELEDLDKYLEDINLSIIKNDIYIKIQHKDKDQLDINLNQLDKRLQRIFDYSEQFLIIFSNENIKDMVKFKKEDNFKEISFISAPKLQFINSSKPNSFKLTILYSFIQELNIQDKFLKYLQIIDNNIIRIEPQFREKKSFLRVTLKNPHRSMFSSELGEGTNRYIEILCTLLSNSNGTVLIDEIENGIHYTKLYDIWKAIIEIVEKEEIQLFVTTHDRESIEALNRASEDMKFKKITSVTLEKDEDNIIYPIIRKYSSFTATVDSGMDIR